MVLQVEKGVEREIAMSVQSVMAVTVKSTVPFPPDAAGKERSGNVLFTK